MSSGNLTEMSTDEISSAVLNDPDAALKAISTGEGTDNGGSTGDDESSSLTNTSTQLTVSTDNQQKPDTVSESSLPDATPAEQPSAVEVNSSTLEAEVAKINQEPDASEYDTDDDEASVAMSVYNTNLDVNAAAKMSSKRLYDAYIRKLGRMDKDSDTKDTSNRASKLVRGFVDYLRTLDERFEAIEGGFEERVSALENAAKANSPDTSVDNTKTDSGAEVPVKDEKPETPVDEREAAEVDNVKFYSAIDHFDPDGDWRYRGAGGVSFYDRPWNEHIIRVLYNSMDSSTSEAQDESPPGADSIDIVALGIRSKPITTFMRDRLDLDVESKGVVRLSKPFRSLIRNIGSFQKQFKHLQERYGVEKDDGHETREDSEQHLSADSHTVLNNALPFQGLDPDSGEDLVFETEEAFIHFRVLMEFLESYLSPQLRLFERLKSGEETQVTFENLWMLFDTGVTIHCPLLESRDIGDPSDESVHTRKMRQVPQLFRVLGTRGGVPRKSILAPPKEDVKPSGPPHSLSPVMLLPGGTQPNQSSALPSTTSAQQKTDHYTPLSVVSFNIDFDGIKYGTVREVFTFNPYNGPADIRTLEAYPTQFLRPSSQNPLDGEAATKEDYFLNRGSKFLNMTSKNFSYLSYEGWTLGSSREEINSAVVVDFKLSFQEYHKQFTSGQGLVPKFSSISSYWPRVPDGELFDLWISDCGDPWCHSSGCILEKYYSSQSRQIKKLEPAIKSLFDQNEGGKTGQAASFEGLKSALEKHDLVKLLPGTVPGFVLRNRKWVQLDLDQLEETKQRDDWKSLVLPKGHKDMVQAMVETHTSTAIPKSVGASASGKVHMDLVQGKGRGCIILLHGVPGVGKTSTAECVASYANKPLYPITCGDIGYSPEAVETNMEQHFKLADKWGCVLLLDEADVFLAKRSKTDVKRNGLVSVFLRILEYYPGILFLTTNRVGAIDDAFRSRLHLTLYYPPLEGEQALKIWKNHLHRIKSINVEREKRRHPPISIDKNKIYKWAKEHESLLQWNGRQIRNAFQTAIALAEFRAKSLEVGRSKSGSTSTSGTKAKKIPSGPAVTVTDFATIANASLQFNQYLKDTHGVDEETLAERDQTRRRERKTAQEEQTNNSGRNQLKTNTIKPQTIIEVAESSSEFTDSQADSEDEDAADDASDSDLSSDASSVEAPTKKTKKSELTKKKQRSTDIQSGGEEEEKGKRKTKKKKKSADGEK